MGGKYLIKNSRIFASQNGRNRIYDIHLFHFYFFKEEKKTNILMKEKKNNIYILVKN